VPIRKGVVQLIEKALLELTGPVIHEVIKGFGSQLRPRLGVKEVECTLIRSIVVAQSRNGQLLVVVRKEAITRMLFSDEGDKFSEAAHFMAPNVVLCRGQAQRMMRRGACGPSAPTQV